MFRKLLKISLYLALFIAVIATLEYARMGFHEDLSLQPINRLSAPDIDIPEPSGRPPVFLISYVAGGEHYFKNQNAMSHYAINKGIDFILNYRKSHIDQAFFEKNRAIFNEKHGAGMWVWKPYIILRTLEKAPDDSVIIYMDAAFKIKKPLNDLIEKLKDADVVLVHDHDRKNGAYIKGDTFALMNATDDASRQAPHIWSAVILIKNTPRSRAFMKKWLEACQDERILNASAYGIKANYPEYQWHHFDQSVLSLVYVKNPEGVKVIEFNETKPFMSWFHRKGGPSSPLKPWYTVYGADPVFDFNRSGKTLSSTALLNIPPIVWLRKWYLQRRAAKEAKELEREMDAREAEAKQKGLAS